MEDYNPRDHVAGGSFGWYVGAPVRFFSRLGIVGVPFILAYTLLLIITGTVVTVAFIWGVVNAFMYLLFGHM